MDMSRAYLVAAKRREGRAAAFDHAGYRTISCPLSFEDRFFDPDHPKDSDWVSDIDYVRLFGRDGVVGTRRRIGPPTGHP